MKSSSSEQEFFIINHLGKSVAETGNGSNIGSENIEEIIQRYDIEGFLVDESSGMRLPSYSCQNRSLILVGLSLKDS